MFTVSFWPLLLSVISLRYRDNIRMKFKFLISAYFEKLPHRLRMGFDKFIEEPSMFMNFSSNVQCSDGCSLR